MKERQDSSFNSIKTVATLLIGLGELILSWAAGVAVGPCDSDAGAGVAGGRKCFRVRQSCLLPGSHSQWFRKAGAATPIVLNGQMQLSLSCGWFSLLLVGIGRRSGTFSTSEIHRSTWHICCLTQVLNWLEFSPFQMANFMVYLGHRYNNTV